MILILQNEETIIYLPHKKKKVILKIKVNKKNLYFAFDVYFSLQEE